MYLGGTLPLLDEILDWTSKDLTCWQRDAVRRLFQKQALSNEDYDDLYAMLKSAHGMPDSENRQPLPLAQMHLPARIVGSAPVILKVMRDLKDVNRIAIGQKINFSPKGITILYGGNGSGKSGYSRVLKQACRARDITEVVYPDAFDPKAIRNIPEATFDIEVGSESRSIAWKRGLEPPEELSTIAVFDGRCARAYLDSEQDVAYLPYGLDVVENLGQKVLPQLMQKLNAEILAINIDATAFADLLGGTSVGKIIATLSAGTDPQKIIDLATLTADEIARLDELEKALSENDPKAKAKALKILIQRLASLIARIDVLVISISDTAVEGLKTCDNAAEIAIKVEVVAAESFRAGEPLLAGTGDEVWKTLFASARRFSTEAAYISKDFPNTEKDAQCLLCQRALDLESGERMKRFETFIKQDASKISEEKRQQLEKEVRKISSINFDLGLDSATSEELNQLDASLFKSLQEFEKKIQDRKIWVLNAFKTHTWNGCASLEGDPRADLKANSEKLLLQANDLDKAANEEQKKVLESERAELRARKSLSARHQGLIDLIKRMQLKHNLTKCKEDLKTKAISDKSKDFTSKAVTVALKTALDKEFKELGMGHIKTKLNERVEQGKMKHKLVLDIPVIKKIDEILSEGEQRAIAIGAFLAELHLSGHQGGIIFDDPVSSLDHHRRKDVARRLVLESKVRQVIILTHETSFLGELRDIIEQQPVDHLIYYLEWRGGNPGHGCDGLPWEHKNYRERLDAHEKAQKILERTWPTYPNEEDKSKMRHEYDLLRATIERVIQDVVFNGVVQRYRDWIKVPELSGVVGFAEVEFNEINRLHKTCCRVVDSHDAASAKNATVPSAVELARDIADLKKVTEVIKARIKAQTRTP